MNFHTFAVTFLIINYLKAKFMKRQIFRVEQKTGKMPEIAWKTVLERDINFCDDDTQFNSVISTVGRCYHVTTDSIMESLRFLYPGEQYRVILICE